MKRFRQSDVAPMKERYAAATKLPNVKRRWMYACGHKRQADSTHHQLGLESEEQHDSKRRMTSPGSFHQIFEDEVQLESKNIKAARDIVKAFANISLSQGRSEDEIRAVTSKSCTPSANFSPRLNQDIRSMENAFARLSVTSEIADNQAHMAVCDAQTSSSAAQSATSCVAPGVMTYTKGSKDEPVMPYVGSQQATRTCIMGTSRTFDKKLMPRGRCTLSRIRRRVIPRRPSKLPSGPRI